MREYKVGDRIAWVTTWPLYFGTISSVDKNPSFPGGKSYGILWDHALDRLGLRDYDPRNFKLITDMIVKEPIEFEYE